MNILIYGSSGWIGTQFVTFLQKKLETEKNLFTFIKGNSRVDNENDILSELMLIKPTHVISFIGRTHGVVGTKIYSTIDYLEQPGKLVENIRDNLFSPMILAELCKRQDIHYTYIGTGCIFNSSETIPSFNENSLPNYFGSGYSIVKGFTDRLMHLYSKNVLNLRIRMPISNENNPRDFITKITKYEKICSISNSMTVLPELLPVVFDMMQNRLVGTINLTNPGIISHNEILTMYKEIIDPKFTWQNFSLEEQRKILASDRSNNELDTTKLQQLYPNIDPINIAIRKCLIKRSCQNL